VDLVNSQQFAKLSLAMKLPDQPYDQDWATLGRTRGSCFEFDIDGTIWHLTTFENELRRLYDYLGFDDFDQVRDACFGYYKKYINLHT
jgi:hypothetical protein